MLKAWLSPEGTAADLLEGAAEKAARLAEAAARGARFLALPVREYREAAEWILASFHSPLAVVPLPPALPPAARERLLAQLPGGSVVELDNLPPGAIEPPPALKPRPLEEVWAVIFSSGSSGQPKGVALSGSALRAAALAHAEHSGAGDACWLLDLPLYHVGGFSVVSRAFFLGAPIAFGAPRFDAAATSTWILSGRVQGLSLVPTTLFRLLEIPGLDFSTLRLVLLGGAAADPALVERALFRGLPLRLTYGMTEHASQIATEGRARGGLEPLPGVDLRISEEDEILVRSSCLAGGYYQEGKLEPLPTHEGFFLTGDQAEGQGSGLRVRGRKSEMIVSGGVKIFPAELENEVAKLAGLRDSAVTGVPHPEWGEVVCVLYVPVQGAGFSPATAKKLLAQHLDARKLPKLWLPVEGIPRSGAGKPLRAEIRALAAGLVR